MKSKILRPALAAAAVAGLAGCSTYGNGYGYNGVSVGVGYGSPYYGYGYGPYYRYWW